MKVLIVDDEPTLCETVETKLRRKGYTTFTAESAEDGMRLFKLVKPDIILLDVMLPNRSGYELCQAVRKGSQVPVIFLTAKASEEDRVAGLEMGADDYVVKPFSLAELAVRVKNVLRRSVGDPTVGDAVEFPWLLVDPRTHEAFVNKSGADAVAASDDFRITLSPKEFALLHFLARNPGQVFSRDTLLDRVWGADAFVSPRTVDVHVRWLREQIETDPASPVHVLTVRGVGYKFVG
ncbi:MAG: response regulator transcription factor [Armatimonadetes bacterium]|nr:response regulator transcription factor [Armatimonadota bacterium]